MNKQSKPRSKNASSKSSFNYLIFGSIGLAVAALLFFATYNGEHEPPPATVQECKFADVKPDLDKFVSDIHSRILSKETRVEACNDYADLISDNSSTANAVADPLTGRSCGYFDSDQSKRYLVSRATVFRLKADHVCGAGLARRVEAGKLLSEFTDIVEHDTAGEAARRIGDRMEFFAPNIELRNCLETAGIRNEPAVMSQPFNQVVASCEVLLGLPAQTPDDRWPLPSVEPPSAE